MPVISISVSFAVNWISTAFPYATNATNSSGTEAGLRRRRTINEFYKKMLCITDSLDTLEYSVTRKPDALISDVL